MFALEMKRKMSLSPQNSRPSDEVLSVSKQCNLVVINYLISNTGENSERYIRLSTDFFVCFYNPPLSPFHDFSFNINIPASLTFVVQSVDEFLYFHGIRIQAEHAHSAFEFLCR